MFEGTDPPQAGCHIASTSPSGRDRRTAAGKRVFENLVRGCDEPRGARFRTRQGTVAQNMDKMGLILNRIS
jgi:hypothetical protein